MTKRLRIEDTDDIIAISDLAHQIWPVAFKDILSKQQIAYMLEMMYSHAAMHKQLKDGVRFLLAMDDQRAYGFCGYQLNCPNAGIAKIHKLYILPEWQGVGIGLRLMKRVELIATTNAMVKLTLNVNRYNKAVLFYKKIGFYIVSEEDISIGQGYLMEDYVMVKDLSS